MLSGIVGHKRANKWHLGWLVGGSVAGFAVGVAAAVNEIKIGMVLVCVYISYRSRVHAAWHVVRYHRADGSL